MTDSFLILTIFGTIIAIYSVLPEHRKLRINYSFGKSEKIILSVLATMIIILSILILFVSLHYETSYLFIHNFELKIIFVLEFLQIISALLIFIVFLLKVFKKRAKIKNKQNFVEKINELSNKNMYTPVITLFEENYSTISNSDTREKNPLRDAMWLKLLNYNFVKQVINLKPYFGLKIINDKDTDIYFRRKFANIYLTSLLKNKNSILYEEINYNKNLSIDRKLIGYNIPKSNRLLYTLFSNMELCRKIYVWKPIGETVIDLLDKNYMKGSDKDVYNRYQEKFMGESDELFEDAIFVGIRFFDILVIEAMYNKVNWHMWLYYYSHFVDRICRNYEINEYGNMKAEFPNAYSYLLYEIISNLKKWISLINKDTSNVKQDLKYVDCSHENGNIIKSSIICLVQCNQKILNTNKIPDSFKEYLTHMIFELYFDLVLNNKKTAQKYGKVLISCILDKIDNYGRKDERYKQYLIDFLESLDKPPIITRSKGSKELKELKNKISNS